MPKCIVYSPHEGGVTITWPSPNCLRWMCLGGRWAGQPRGFVETQIERQIAVGMRPDAARRFAHALAFGGCTEVEALAIIRDRDCAHKGRMIELWEAEDVPADRWFRDAWHRSDNGGPISINLRKARRIQFDNIKSAVAGRNRKRIELGRSPIVPAWGEIGNAIRHARDEEELRRVWIQ